MKNQALFSSKDKSKNRHTDVNIHKMSLLQHLGKIVAA